MERKLIELYRQLHDDGAFFFERKLPIGYEDKKSAIIKIGDNYGVFMDTDRVDSVAEETELVCHECGHMKTGTTHSVCSPVDLVEKHEYKAKKWSVHELLPKEEIEQAVKDGYVEPWEIAERLGRTESFVRLAIDIYRAEGIEFLPEFSEELFPVLWAASM